MKEGSRLHIFFERHKSLPGICHVGIKYDQEAYCEAMQRELEKYKREYNNGKKTEIPKEFHKPKNNWS